METTITLQLQAVDNDQLLELQLPKETVNNIIPNLNHNHLDQALLIKTEGVIGVDYLFKRQLLHQEELERLNQLAKAKASGKAQAIAQAYADLIFKH